MNWIFCRIFKFRKWKKEEVLKIIRKLHIKRNYQNWDKNLETIESSKIKKLWLDKEIEEKIIEKIEWYLWWENKIIVWNYTWKFKTPEENAKEVIDFKESNDLSEKQNEKFSELWKKLERRNIWTVSQINKTKKWNNR